MKHPGQFGSSKPPVEKTGPGATDCGAFELWLAEFTESGSPDATMDDLRTHLAGCTACQEKLAQARRGREWLQVLKQEALEPPAGMVAKILARTSVAGLPRTPEERAETPLNPRVRELDHRPAYVLPAYDSEAVAGMRGDADDRSRKEAGSARKKTRSGTAVPTWQRNTVVVLRRTLIEPRLAMVAAMAFFSISLTLNMAGVRLTNLHPADLAPSNMRRAASRQYAEVNARVARYYENLRIVYEVEARVQQLRRAAETSPAPQQESRPRKRSSNATGDTAGGEAQSHHEGLVKKHSVEVPAIPDPTPIRTGPRVNAALEWSGEARRSPFNLVSAPLVTTSSPVHVPTARLGRAFASLKMTTLFRTATPFCMIWFSRRSLSAPERGFA